MNNDQSDNITQEANRLTLALSNFPIFNQIFAVQTPLQAAAVSITDADQVFVGMDGPDIFTGDPLLVDAVDYSNEGGGASVLINMPAGTAIDTFGTTDSFTDIDLFIGTDGPDAFIGDALANSFFGLGGADSFIGGAGADVIDGGEGETLGLGAGFLDSDLVNYNAEGGGGGVTVDLSSNIGVDSFGDTDTLIEIENVNGTSLADAITGDAEDNIIRGFGGADELFGGAGADQLFGNGGGDTLSGDAGDDILVGGGGSDIVEGGAGADLLVDGSGADTLSGGSGDDTVRGGAGSDQLDGGAGFDVLDYFFLGSPGPGGVQINLVTGTVIDSFGGTDTISNFEQYFGTGQADMFTGGAGDDFFRGFGGADVIDGGAGDFDQVSWEDLGTAGAVGVVADLGAGSANVFGAAVVTISNVEMLRGSNANDDLTGDAARNILRGLDGADRLDGGAGRDDARSDLDAGRGGMAGVTVNLAAGTAIDGFGAQDELVNIEDVVGTRFNDVITGDAAANNLFGGADVDQLNGGGGDDVLNGGEGDDALNGGAGVFDRAQFSGDVGDYSIVFEDDGSLTVTHLNGGSDGADSLVNIELLRFAGGVEVDVLGLANTAPTDILFTSDGVVESQFGAEIGTLAAEDDGLGGAPRFSVDDIRFDITGGTTLKFASDFQADFEANGDAIGVTVEVEDAFGETFSKQLTVSVQDVAEDVVLADGGVNFTDEGVQEDSVTGGSGDDAITGTAGDDRLSGGGGDDVLNGLGGVDTATFSSPLSAYSAVLDGDVVVVTHLNGGADGVDRLSNFEAFEFADVTVDLDQLLSGAPDGVALSAISLIENAPGAVIGTLSLIDDNAVGAPTFSVDDDRFEAVGDQLKLKSGVSVDFEAGPEIELTIEAVDARGSAFRNFTLDVEDIPENVQLGPGGVIYNERGLPELSVTGGGGDDILRGGPDADNFAGANGADIIRGGRGQDIIAGQAGNDIITGDREDDIVTGGAGDDVVRGGAGNDVTDGGAGNDRVIGDRDEDDVRGGAGNDAVKGGLGDDRVSGGTGNDNLFGNGGADVFVFASGDGVDVVKDFENDFDRIDLSDAAVSTFDELSPILMQAVNGGVIIEFGGGDALIIRQTQVGDLSAGDFIF
ncbi:MAG: hypothetical protein KTR21_09135 [Rhodobacteraceae bacterium]|nr:hypothetical protein [Paracoccaceae bacterium]